MRPHINGTLEFTLTPHRDHSSSKYSILSFSTSWLDALYVCLSGTLLIAKSG
ncbi:hypothetical protein BDN72DRAFT_843727 [Pluteus cervinus]|uniref:Uncharacterized protein n=1 Tax=Pluteus cervinus TaxID=181527 RepID=A0ACD3AMB8_9AGAR|nr:hypothetical protein BDN72DRAFT_843727 [Pluteus cervinus]